ncbi:ATP-binding protein [Mesorhizobium sp. B2-4-6]|uniref:ATP-binding protein n=1 Tax=Mesorhizobium sp. B2-4-6 TaxID=2589943 RepID=UPI00112D3A04|nr:ATP-binding protein [Mesorhizobium sp. B2-4-6]TPL49894.1 GHKL domain-containing protein [Mesorhizobium sp. B2-4-6]
MTGFRVDTKLFQELGELLVAKESTALVELIKNAYDADATFVTVQGIDLASADRGRIVVSDDGVGMTEEEFTSGFLTIAGRTKNTGDRRSPIFGRRYTGEKGVGRLASHKLGTRLVVVSRKAGAAARGAKELPPSISSIRASIDWLKIEELETLDEIADSGAVIVRAAKSTGEPSGTTLKIAPLRTAWSDRIKRAFLNEAATLAPAIVLSDPLSHNVAAEPLLFEERIPVQDQHASDPGFSIAFTGDLSIGDQLIPDVAQAAGWIAELEFDSVTGLLRVAIAPTWTTKKRFPGSEGFRFERQIGVGVGPTFRARIFQQSNNTWDRAVQGVRVFMEGFRVPPYGDPHDDWLDLERDYKSRAHRQLTRLSSLDVENLPAGLSNEEIVVQGNAAYMGAVFLHRSSSQGLQMLVNREGFLPSPELDFVSRWVRVAIDLIVRLGYASRKEVKEVQKAERIRQRGAVERSSTQEAPTALLVRESAIAAEKSFAGIEEAIKRNDYAAAAEQARAAQPHIAEIRSMADEFGSEAVMWRVLASLGAELAAFVHEINVLGLQIAGLVADLEAALGNDTLPGTRSAIRHAKRRALELADRIRRNATYLVDATSFEGRRRRSRQPLADRFDAVVPFFLARIEQRGLKVENAIPADLRTPPMFPSELSGIFTNLLSNAVKFTDKNGRIRVEAREERGAMVVAMYNTGQAVDLGRGHRLFEAFQSTTERPDAILGQGMGMGLTITRAFVQEYGGEIAFIPPPKGFATSIEFTIPLR